MKSFSTLFFYFHFNSETHEVKKSALLCERYSFLKIVSIWFESLSTTIQNVFQPQIKYSEIVKNFCFSFINRVTYTHRLYRKLLKRIVSFY